MLFKTDYKIFPENLPDTMVFKTLEPQVDSPFIMGTDNDDRFSGTPGDDNMSGFDGDDRIRGHEGDDIIGGGNGNDTLQGEQGNDTIYGGDGNDLLNGGRDDDVLTGGNDADIFQFTLPYFGWGNDVITDFEDGVDMIEITNGRNSFDYSRLQITDTVDGALIEYGSNSILVNGVAAADINQDDFII